MLLSLDPPVAALPALLVLEAYLDADPAPPGAEARERPDLNASDGIAAPRRARRGSEARLGVASFAIGSALFFGLGFGRVLQLTHSRTWGLTLPKKGVHPARYAAVLLALYGLIFLLLFQAEGWRESPIVARP